MREELRLGNFSDRGQQIGSAAKFALFAGVLCFAGALSANASTITITGTSGAAATCTAGLTGTFTIDAAGGVLLEAPNGTGGCYVGGYSGTAASPTPNGTDTTYINITGVSTEGTAAQLFSLTTGWYAEFGVLCGGPGQCTASQNSSNNNNSGDIEILVNSGGTSKNFQIQDNTGAIDSIFNAPSASGCGANVDTKTFTVAANTICIEDLSTSVSISLTIGAPSSVPEPSSFGFMSIGGG